MKKAFLDYLGAAIMFFVMALVVFIIGLCVDDASHSKRIIFGATPIILCITFVFVFLFLHRYMIFAKINKIKRPSEQSITIVCKKVTFLTHPTTRNSFVIISIGLTDENGKKYYNITQGIPDFKIKDIKNKLLNSEVNLVCYQNTNYIKSYQAVANKD